MGKQLNTELFIEKSSKKHNYKYDYSKSVYNYATDRVIIICPIHGEFTQVASEHIWGKGCKECGLIKKALSKTRDKKQFIDKVTKIHENKYDYSLVKYVNSLTTIKIICPFHGVFEKVPWVHLKQGCPKCIRGSWNKTDWVEKALRHKESLLYVIECFNENEKFIKIGITSLGIKARFNDKRFPYSYRIITSYISEPNKIWDMEKSIHKKLKDFRYFPKIKFLGYTKCFTLDILPISFS